MNDVASLIMNLAVMVASVAMTMAARGLYRDSKRRTEAYLERLQKPFQIQVGFGVTSHPETGEVQVFPAEPPDPRKKSNLN